MSDVINRVLANLEHNARRYADEGNRLDAADRSGAATVANDVVTVTVDGSGDLIAAVFSGVATDPERWRLGFGNAYVEALSQRHPAAARNLVPDLIQAPEPEGPLAPEQDEARARIDRALQRSRTLSFPISDLTRTATVDGISVTVNGMRIIVDATATRAALEGGLPVDDAVMAAHHQALAELDDAITALLEGPR